MLSNITLFTRHSTKNPWLKSVGIPLPTLYIMVYWDLKPFVVTKDVLIVVDSEMTPLKQVSSGERDVWGVGTDGVLHRRIGVSATCPAGIAWQPALSGGAAVIHVSARGQPL